MSKPCFRFHKLDYGNTTNIICLFLGSFPKSPSLSLEKRSITATIPNIFIEKTIHHYEVQTITLKKDESTIKVSELPQPFPTISLEDFIEKHLSPVEQKLMWQDFKKDLWQEVLDKKISKIKYYRIVHKLTQKGLARKLDMEQPNIARLEKVEYTPKIPTLKKLGKIFHIDYKELL